MGVENFIQSKKVSNEVLGKEPADLYLYKITDVLTITSPVLLNDTVINTSDTTDVVQFDVITFYEGRRFFQSLVLAKTASSITVASPIDFAYTTGALVEFGKWNLNLDGSSVLKTAMIKAPPARIFKLHTVNVSMLSTSPMADGLFGSLTQLSKGAYFRQVDGITKNLALITNNLGFREIGFEVNYSDKPPAGKYGMSARRDIIKTNGTVLTLIGSRGDEFQLNNQNDLTGLDTFAITVNGYAE